jgi:hypothetical protein
MQMAFPMRAKSRRARTTEFAGRERASGDDEDGVGDTLEHVLQELGGSSNRDAGTDSDGDGSSDADESAWVADPGRVEQPCPASCSRRLSLEG